MNIKETEYHNLPDGETEVREDGKVPFVLKPGGEHVAFWIDTMRNFYPEALEGCNEAYKASSQNTRYYEFLRVRRFIKCNFGGLDNKFDIDEFGRFNFEFVSCPLRGECKYDGIICKPKFNSKLSDRELEVMKMCYEGKTDDEISSTLYIALNTVGNHRKNSFKKLGIHSMVEFIRYANNKNLFNHD